MKSNRYLLIASILPPLILIVFLGIIFINNDLVEPPKYGVIVKSIRYYSDKPSVSIEVKDNKFIAKGENKKESSGNHDALMYFNFKDKEAVEIDYFKQLTGELNGLKENIPFEKELDIVSLGYNIVSTSTTSPDGFRFKENNGNNEINILMSNGVAFKSKVNKFLYSKKIPLYDAVFLGWTEENNNDK